MDDGPPAILLNPADSDRKLWELVGELADILDDPWVLIGGLMVNLLVREHNPSRQLRTTNDIAGL